MGILAVFFAQSRVPSQGGSLLGPCAALESAEKSCLHCDNFSKMFVVVWLAMHPEDFYLSAIPTHLVKGALLQLRVRMLV